MFETGRKVIGQVRSMFDKHSTKSSKHLLRLGKIEETDLLGAALHKEATLGNRRALKKVLSSAICVDYPNDLGQTPLFCACARDHESTALLLLQWRANPNEKSLNGMTPCHATCYMGNVYLLGKMIEAGGDLRLHDNNGNNMRDWALQNPDTQKRSKMLEFIDKTHMYAMAYSGDTVNLEMFSKYGGRPHRQNSVMEIMMMKTGNDPSFDNLRQVQSTGFGKVYLGNNRNGGIISVVPLINETILLIIDGRKYRTGFHTYIEKMQWLNETVSVKKVKSDVEVDDGKDILIADAEFLGKLRHPNILLLMGICQSASFDKLMLVFEHVQNATLHHLLHHTNHSIVYNDSIRIMQQICTAMDFIHSQSLMHCGLSSMAVYLVSPHTTKVGNFEYMVESSKADLGKPSAVSVESHGEFLYNWMAPELILGFAPRYSSDVYSFCCIIWEIFTREVPWANMKPQAIRKKILDEGTPLDVNNSKIPHKLRSIIGYGLELREEYRLNKFVFIIDWLKSDQQPKFQRISTSQFLKNKSGNSADQLSSSSPSFSSSSSVKNEKCVTCSESWLQDTLDFMSNSECDTSATEKSDGKDNLSPSICGAQSDILRRSLKNRKFPSESNLKDQCIQPMKPASHLNCLSPPDPPLPGSDSYQFHLFERNNSGRFFEWDKDAVLSKDYTSQPQLGNRDESPEIDIPTESVRRMADMYQLHLNQFQRQSTPQHKLRQAILKGSMAPRGSCKDLETSSDSIKSACSRNTARNKYHGKDTENDWGASQVKSSKPKEGPNSEQDAEKQLESGSTGSDVPKLFYTLKEMRTVRTSCKTKNSEEEDSESGLLPRQVGDGMSYSHQKTSRKVATIKNRETVPCGQGEARNYDRSHVHRISMQEFRVAHQKFMKKSVGKYNTESSPDVFYHSPNIEILMSDMKSKDSPLSKCKSIDVNAAHTETQKVHNICLPHSIAQSSGSLYTEVMIQDSGHIQHCRTEAESCYFNDVNTDQEKCENTNYVMRKKTVNFHPVHADFMECEQLDLEIVNPAQSSTNRCGLIQNVDILGNSSNDSVCQAGDQHDYQKHDYTTPRTFQVTESEFSPHKVDEQSFGSDNSQGVGHIKNAVSESETEDLVLSNARDSVCSAQNISVDSDRIYQWVDGELDKIKEKLRFKSRKLFSEQGTESSGSLNGLKDISPSSTLGEDGDKAVKNSDTDILDSRVDGGLKLIGFSEKTSETKNQLQAVPAKTTLEVNGSCDFQFQEFYIDDDFDSAEHILQDISCSNVPLLDCNISTRHTADDNRMPKVIAGSVQKISLHMMNNAEPPVFPRKLKIPENLSLTNLQHSTLNADHAGKNENGSLLPGVTDNDTFTQKNGVPCSSEQMHGLSASRYTPRSAISSDILQCDKNYSLNFGTGDHGHKGSSEKHADPVCRLDEDMMVKDFEDCTDMIDEDWVDTVNQKTVSQSSTIHHFSNSEVCNVGNTEESCISGNRTTGTDLTKERHLTCAAGEDSDCDKWVTNKLKCIQEKIKRRRAREVYIVSSDENSDSENVQQCELTCINTQGIVGNEDTFIRGFYTATSCQVESCEISLKSDSIQNPLQRSDELVATHFLTSESKSRQKVHRFHDLTTHGGSLVDVKKHKHDWSHSHRTNNGIPSFSMHNKEDNKDTTASKKSGSERAEISRLPECSLNSVTDASKNNEKSKQISAHCSDTSKSNTRVKDSVKSMDPSGKFHKWTIWKSLKDKESSSEGSKIISKESCAKKSHRSILRKPSSTTTKAADLKKGNGNCSIPSPVPMSGSKFSVGHDSKLSDKVISFQCITGSKDEISDLEQTPSKRSISLNERSSLKEQSFDSYEYENKIVKTWLERENFAERCSLGSSRLGDHQSITSRVMEFQNMSSRQTHMPHEFPVPSSSLHAENVLHQQSQPLLASEQDFSHKHERASRNSQESLSPVCNDSTLVKSENTPERKSAGSNCFQNDQLTKSKAYRRISEKSSSLDDVQHTVGTSPVNQTNDHCLTLDLRIPDSDIDTGSTTLKEEKKKSYIGLQRFYIPRELYHGGCTARMNIQVSPGDPASHRITTMAIDPVSGQAETLLDQTVFTNRQKSTMKLE